ncbi:TetR family transcriptional regulator [uncultured Roseibium sp.]|uniref:TetR family transcriptional regulator n=1 Tax=uncultured Roseibium sp. TaxID=1936171 RepID=UPI00260601FE|nr:TetR family transcriptional regulator [uncultured Roseibium sp.]
MTSDQKGRDIPRTVEPRTAKAPKRDAERTKKEILAAAMTEFAEYGDTGARIDRIAERAGSNKAMIYSYFGNKEELYAVVLREAYLQIREGERKLDLEKLDPKSAIVELLRFTAYHFRDNPWFLRLLNTENQRRGQTIRQLDGLAELNSPLVEFLREILLRGEKSGVFRKGVDPVEIYLSIASLFYFPLSNTYTLSIVFDPDIGSDAWLEKRIRQAEDMILKYLIAD